MLLSAFFILIVVLPLHINSQSLAQTSYALDVNTLTTQSAFMCMKINQYQVVFIRGYSPDGNGGYDINVAENVRNAFNAGLGTEVYMTPNPNSTKAGSQQFQELYTGLKTNSNFDVKTIWLQITTPIKWEANIAGNIRFINSIIEAAKTYGVTIGIYTSAYDWQQITRDWTGPILTPLWYWNVLGSGPMAEAPSTFDDFHSFGPWATASVKQFGQEEPIVGKLSTGISTLQYYSLHQNRLHRMAKYRLAVMFKKTVSIKLRSCGIVL